MCGACPSECAPQNVSHDEGVALAVAGGCAGAGLAAGAPDAREFAAVPNSAEKRSSLDASAGRAGARGCDKGAGGCGHGAVTHATPDGREARVALALMTGRTVISDVLSALPWLVPRSGGPLVRRTRQTTTARLDNGPDVDGSP